MFSSEATYEKTASLGRSLVRADAHVAVSVIRYRVPVQTSVHRRHLLEELPIDVKWDMTTIAACRVPRAACRVPRAACRVPRAACRV
ncbi:hypothetical protein, partial [Streptomyces oceani]|uniref:hypothetical protein n=1 Tax=Streptomyces oceani TaxID=1075402 RepID=UPI001BAE6AE1